MVYFNLRVRPQSKATHYITITVVAIATAIVIAIAFFVYFNAVKVEGKFAGIEKNKRVERLLDDTLVDFLDAETGQRGFLLTGNSMYLAPYLSGRARIKNHLKRLDGMLSKKDYKYFKKIKFLASKKLNELKTTIALRKQNRLNSALIIVKTNKGIDYMKELRIYISDLKSLYEQRIEAENGWIFKKSEYIKIMLPLVIFGYLFILLVVYIMLYISSKKNIKYEDDLRQAAADLESSYQNEKTAKLFYILISKINNLMPKSSNYEEFFMDAVDLFAKNMETFGVCFFKEDSPYAKVVASAGVKGIKQYTEGLKVSSNKNIPEGLGVYGEAVRSGEVIYSNDFASDRISAPWRQKLTEFNFNSVATIPIKMNNEPFGAFVIYIIEKNYFDEEKIKFLKEISSILSYAIDYIDNRNKLIDERDALNRVIQNIPSGIAIFNEEKFLYTNQELLDLFKLTEEEFLNLSVKDFFNIKEGQIYNSNPPVFKMHAKNEMFQRFIYKLNRADFDFNRAETIDDRKTIYIDLFRTTIPYKGNSVGLAIFSDITDNVLREQNILIKKDEYKELSEVDVLTGAGNRRYFDSKLAKTLGIANRYDRPLSLIMFDIDKFKDINDTSGHTTGDFILKELSGLIKQNLRMTDFFARFGGEEFMIIAIDTPVETAVELAERLRAKISEQNFNIGRQVTCSFGVTGIINGDTNQSIVSRVDEALYDAKKNGRNKVCSA